MGWRYRRCHALDRLTLAGAGAATYLPDMSNKIQLRAEDGHALLHAPTEGALRELARRHRAANGLGMQLLSLVGGQAEGLLDRLPAGVRSQLDTATLTALDRAARLAARSRQGPVPAGRGWMTTAVTTAMGAVGGAGGGVTSLAEIPVTTTILLRAVMDIAADHGFDPTEEGTRADCVQVLAAAGPMKDDDGADLGFLTARATLTGATLHSVIAKVAPRLSIVLGQKLAAQTVPVLGAVAGAATNYTFTTYYQEMARISFHLRRMAQDSDQTYDTLVSDLQEILSEPRR